MTPLDDGGVQSVYNFWLGLIPQFFGQFGVKVPGGNKAAAAPGAADPAAWLGPWAAAMPLLAGMQTKSGEGETAAAQAMFGPWAAMLAPYPGGASKTASPAPAPSAAAMFGPWMAAWPTGAGAQGSGTGFDAATAALQPFQAAQQAWLDFAAGLTGVSPQTYLVGFDRTFGGLFDALGFGPLRKLQAACQDLASASVLQNQSRASYALLVQGAFTSGLERLMTQLAAMADAGERVDSVLVLLRMWAVSTEQAVHELLQSEPGLAATASLTRSGLAHRRKLQHVASIVADALDLATRRELDEAYRHIHELKREVRALRAPVQSAPAPAAKPRSRSRRRTAK